MKKFLVKIDVAGFRKNPRAGETTTPVVGTWSGSVTVTGNVWVPERPEQGYLLREWDEKRNVHKYVTACEKSLADLVEALRQAGVLDSDIKWEMNRDVRFEEHPPLPQWEFRYIPTEVECSECHSKFPHTHLLSDVDADGFGYAASDEICPNCGAWDCCELEFEQPQEVADRLFIV